MNKTEIVSLIDELYEAAEAYYQGLDSSPLTDVEFDSKQELLREICEKGAAPELFVVGSRGFNLLEGTVALGTSSEKLAITHSAPMLSLAKAKKPEDLQNFLKKVEENGGKLFKIQAKLDGIALSAVYVNGRLSHLATRGDGEHGEDVTFLVNDPKVSVVGLPERLEGDVELRGELFFTSEQFEKVDEERVNLTGERFKNARNAAGGLLKKSEIGVDFPVEFTFSTYATLKNGVIVEAIENNEIITVEELTKKLAQNIKISNLKEAEVLSAVNKFGEIRESLPIPTDGVVIKPMNTAKMYDKMGVSNHHPKSQIAWKYPSEQAHSEILEITVSVGKSGKLTPRAKITPVSVDGSTVEYASLHNFSILYNLDARVGSKVIVEKANEIIPQIVSVTYNPEGSEKFPIPTNCYYCDATLTTKDKDWPPKTLTCPNTQCSSRGFFVLKTAVGRGYLDIDRLGEVSIEELYNTGKLTNVADLYDLTMEDLKDSVYGYSAQGNPRRLGETISKHILQKIEESKTRPLDKLIGALAIEGLGRRTAATILKVFPNMESLQNATVEELIKIDGVGEITANNIVDGLQANKGIIDRMIAAGVQFNPKTPISQADNILAGQAFSISGKVPSMFKNRGEMVEFIEANGGEFHSSPKASTTHMIGDPTSTSSKIKKAISLGLTIVDPESFSSLL